MRYSPLHPIRFFLLSTILVLACSWALPAAAQVTVTDGNITATFSSAPLFSAPTTGNIAPAASKTGTITVVNNSTSTESVLLAAVATSSTGLAQAVELVVTEAGLVRYTGSFADFFAVTSVPLSDLAPGASSSYTLTATFLSSSGNEFQGTEMGFDLRIGFASGAGVSNPPGGGGGGGGGSIPALIQPPTPGSTNVPDGQVAGAATSNNLGNANQLWDAVVAAVGSAIWPERMSQEAASVDEEPAAVADSNNRQIDAAFGTYDELIASTDRRVEQTFCIVLWFILLALLGVLGRYCVQYPVSNEERGQVINTLRTHLLLFTLGYVLLLYILSFFTGISTLIGWILFSVWALYQAYDHVVHWQITGWLSRLRLGILGIGVLLLFLLPNWISWLCAWW